MKENELRINGDLIRDLRKRKNWSAGQLAERSELTDQFIYRVERNEQDATFPVISRIASALGVPSSLLLISADSYSTKVMVGDIEFTVPDELVDSIIRLIIAYRAGN